MQPANSNTVSYTSTPIPVDLSNPEVLRLFLKSEFVAIQAAIAALAAGHIDVTHVAPQRPRDGDIRLADGTHWNPGSGQGVYAYYASAWHLLG